MKHLHRRSPWERLQDFIYNHKKLSIGLTIGMFALAFGGGGLTWFLLPPMQSGAAPTPQQDNQTAASTATVKKFYSPLTGVEIADEAATKRQVTGIMIENSPSARPQSGIKDAGLVFEAIAEGGITRLATLHQEDRPGLIGPVRSIRPYYLDWMAPFDAAISHVGGSANALQTVRNGSFKDIDQFFNGGSYWRATDRVAPHNVYTDFDRLDALNKNKGFTGSAFTGWPRKKDTPVASPSAGNIQITVSSPTYNVRYEYDKTNNSYIRFIGGAPSKDREAGQIAPKVVIALKVPTQLGFEDGQREQMTTEGHNEAFVFQDGTVTKGFWRKTGQKNQMQFYDKNGRIIALNPGQTWVTVVAPDKAITWQ